MAGRLWKRREISELRNIALLLLKGASSFSFALVEGKRSAKIGKKILVKNYKIVKIKWGELEIIEASFQIHFSIFA